MATPILPDQSTSSESIIAGYFAEGDDAHRAINALLDEGFLPSQIGAAFHSSANAGPGSREEVAVLGGESTREELGTTVTTTRRSDNSMAGPASDDSAVQPAGIATGSGSPFLGVGRPGPISGSSLEHTGLPSELERELPTQAELGSTGGVAAAPVSAPVAHTGSAPQHHIHPQDKSWSGRLKHLFHRDAQATPSSPATAESQNFGTGEGSLGIAPPYGSPYVAADFERSIASSGVAPEHSRHLSQRLTGGGAVVTVSATGRAIEVERIFERHNGYVRFASAIFDDAPASLSSDSRVEVFGHLEHIYPATYR